MSAITICNGVFLHTPHFLLLECFVRQVQVFTSFIACLKRASQSWSCWSLVELLGLFDGRRAGVQKVAAELSAHSHAPRLWWQGWGGRGAPSQPARGCRHISCDTAHCGTAAGARLPCHRVHGGVQMHTQAGLKMGNVLLEHLTSLLWELRAAALPQPAPP